MSDLQVDLNEEYFVAGAAHSNDYFTSKKQCNCGSPNCNSLACIKTVTRNNSLLLIGGDSIEKTKSPANIEVSVEREGFEEDLGENEKVEEESKFDDEYDLIPVKDDSVKTTKVERDGCWCSFRQSNDQLVQQYIEQFKENLHFSSHLHKLNHNSGLLPLRTSDKGTFVCTNNVSIRETNMGTRSGDQKWKPAIARKIDTTPFDFLNDNAEKVCNVAKIIPKKNTEFIIINCSINDDDKKAETLHNSLRICGNYNKLQNAKVDKLFAHDNTPSSSDSCRESTSSNQCPNSKKKSKELTRKRNSSVVTFEKSTRRLSSRSQISKRKIGSRKRTPYLPGLLLKSKGIQTKGEMPAVDLSFHACPYLSSEEEDELEDYDISCNECEQKLKANAYTQCCNEVKSYQSANKRCGSPLEKPKKHKRVISIKICGGRCGCLSPTTSSRTRSTYSKLLNEKSKKLSQMYPKKDDKTPTDKLENSKSCNSKMCLKKLMEQPVKNRAQLMEEQAKRVKSSQCQFSKGFLKDFIAPWNKNKMIDKCECTTKENQVQPIPPVQQLSDVLEMSMKEDRVICVDQFTCTCSANKPSNKQTNCKPIQKDHTTETIQCSYPEPDLCSWSGIDQPFQVIGITGSLKSRNCCNQAPVELPKEENLDAECTCRNICHDACTNACSKPCMLRMAINSSPIGNQNQWAQFQPVNIQFPFSERCNGPRYCMNMSQPYQIFYPAIAVQVDSEELIDWPVSTQHMIMTSNVPKQKIIGAVAVAPEVTVINDDANESEKNDGEDEEGSGNNDDDGDDEQDESEDDDDEDDEDIIRSFKARNSIPVHKEGSPKYAGKDNVTSGGSLKEISSSEEIIAVPMDSISPKKKKKVDNLKPGEGGKSPTMPGKQVSMKYDFNLYDGNSMEEAKTSPVNSIEERIRILRKNLEQRHDFGSESASNRSQNTIHSFKDKALSLQDEMEIMPEMTEQNFPTAGRNKANNRV